MSEAARHDYPDRDTLMRSVAELVADQLRGTLGSKHRATLAVPGGTTPGPFLQALADEDLDWSKVTVLPTDERLVPEESPRSNARLIREALLRDRASSARFVGLTAAAATRRAVEAALPVDVLVLGMGADMHTASLFPGSPDLAAALSDDAPVLVEVEAPGQPERRVTLSAQVLRGAYVSHILITGQEKLAALKAALVDGPVEEAPVRAVLTAPCPVYVHYAD